MDRVITIGSVQAKGTDNLFDIYPGTPFKLKEIFRNGKGNESKI